MAERGFQGLAERHDLLMHGAVGRRLAALFHGLFVAMNPVVLNLAGGDFREAHGTKERHQVHARARVLAFDIDSAALALRDDIVFTQVRGLTLRGKFFLF